MVDVGFNKIYKNTLKAAENTSKTYNCVIVMFYDYENNYFVDETGTIIYELFKYITPNELLLFKQMNEDLFILRPNGDYIEMIAPEYLPY